MLTNLMDTVRTHTQVVRSERVSGERVTDEKDLGEVG